MLTAPAIPLSDRDRNLGLAANVVSSFFVGMTFGLGYPIASLKLANAGASDWIIGLVGAAPSLAVILLLPVVPRVVRRYGAVAAMLAGGLVTAAGYAALIVIDGPVAWFAVRFVMGASVAASWLISQTWVTVGSEAATRGRVLALYVMAFSSGMAICPGLLDYLGVETALPALVGAGAALIAILPVVAVNHLAPPVDSEDATSGSVWIAVKLAPIAMIGAFFAGFVEMTQLSLLPAAGFAIGLEQSPALLLLTMFSVGALTLQLPFGWLSDKLPPPPLCLAMILILAIVCLGQPWALPFAVIGPVCAFLVGGLDYGLYTVALAIVGDHKNREDSGASNAAFIVSHQLGGMIGPAMTGAAMTVGPVSGFAGTQFAAGVLIAVLGYRLHKSMKDGA